MLIEPDCYTQYLAPLCFAILSDKSKERSLALSKLHSILPSAVKQKDFTSDTAGKVLKSFLDWLHSEIRISRKSSSTTTNTNMSTVLKEVKWLLILLDVHFPRINLSSVLFELIDRLIEALNFNFFPEIAFILNNQILSKLPYLKLLEKAKETLRFSRLVKVITDRPEEHESLIKSLTFLAISIPSPLKLDPLIYELFHGSFLKFVSSCDNCGFLTSLLGAIVSLSLDYFEHSLKFANHYVPYVLNWMRLKNTPLLFNKCLQFISIIIDNINEHDRLSLTSQFEKELDDPQNCHLYQLDPITFCFEIVDNTSLGTFSQSTRFMFLDLCYKLNICKSDNIPLKLFKLLKYNYYNEEFVDSQTTSSDWSLLLQFHTDTSSATFNSFTPSKSSISWYKVWFISRNPELFPCIKMDDLDDFINKTLISSSLPLDSLGFEAFSAYFHLRFKDLLWTQSASNIFKCFIYLINDQNVPLSPYLVKCLLPHCVFDFKIDHEDDQKSLDSFLFLNRLTELNEKVEALYKRDFECVNNPILNYQITIPDSFIEILKSIEHKNPILKFFSCLFDKNSTSPQVLLDFIFDNLDSFWLFDCTAPLLTRKIPITELLSVLIPKIQIEPRELEHDENNSGLDAIDSDFKMKTLEYEVNPTFPSVYKMAEFKNNKLIKLAFILLNHYEANIHDNDPDETRQILEDWKVFMTDFEKNNPIVIDTTTISSQLDLANLLKECRPFFDIPVIKIDKIDSTLVLPNILTVQKKITTPEQWIPFLCTLFRSETTSIDSTLQYLQAIPIDLLSTSSRLKKLIKSNLTLLISHEFFRKWIELSRHLPAFPFDLFTEDSPIEFIFKSPFLTLALTKYPSITASYSSDNNNNNNNCSPSSYPFIKASILLEESLALTQSRAPFKFPNFLLNCECKSLVPLASAILSHGQFFAWPVVLSALQTVAKLFKLSSASDLSELFNPIHAIFILKSLALNFSSSNFLKKLFSSIPTLNHYPQLLKFTLKLILAQPHRQPFELLDLEREFCINSKDFEPLTVPSPSNDFVPFVLKFGHSKLFSGDSKLIQLLFELLNLTNLNGSRVFPLESFEHCLSTTVRVDLKMLLLPQGSKVLCFPRRATGTGTGTVTGTGTGPATVKTNQFAENQNYWENVSKIEFITDLCKFLCSFNDEIWSGLVLNLLDQVDPENIEFIQSITPHLLDSMNKKAAYTVIPEVIQKLTNGLVKCTQPDICQLIVNLLHLFIEKTPIGPNVIDTILRRFSFNTKVFKILQNDSISKPSVSLYYFSLLRESPKQANTELDLEELGSLLTGENGDYLEIVKKRLSRFDDYEIEWPEVKKQQPPETTSADKYSWLDRKWFDQGDFCPKNLLLADFTGTVKNLNKLYSILMADESVLLEKDHDELFNILRSCCVSRRKLTLTNFQEISNFASKIDRQHFKVLTLLPLCSPKLDQVSRHLLADTSSQIHWQRGEYETALEIAKEAYKLFPVNILPDQCRALLLSRIGDWSATSKSDRPSHILSQYFDKAMALCENTANFSKDALAQIHIKVARFLDEQYQQIKESEDFKNRSKLLEESRAALNAARNTTTTTQDHIITTLRNQYELDMQEYSERKRALNSFLTKSVENYLSALSFGIPTEKDQMGAISRLCALWFSNSDFPSINESINNAINTTKKSLPLQLFLPLIYQLAARASYDRTEAHPTHFQRTLVRLLVQLTIQFPFNCIYQLLALRAGSVQSVKVDDPLGDDPSVQGSKRRKLLLVDEPQKNETDLRSAAASLIIDQSRRIPSLTAPIRAIEILSDSYIELANTAPSTKNGINDFPTNLKIKRLLYPLPNDSALRQIPIPTGPVDGEAFAGFIDGYRLLGGINLPKCIEAVSNSGTRHPQLVKGRDDVRQDAVMEQVFLKVNKLLLTDEVTRNRGLSLRTYRVIPLCPLVGLIEWVPDSIPLATYLNEAHERLRPGDIPPSKCRELLKIEAERPGSTIQSKFNIFVKEIGQRFRPVLRHFFFEHFTLNSWWTAKQAYTRSLATASIVGWIVGLGDRHGMNILLDKRTGEIVHIDLNMIFEAGRTLRVPERVPFRLTPDCVDGLGPERIGLEGPFKDHATATMKVLRRERALIMMILDVFKYDPLQKWTGLAKVIEKHSINRINQVNTVNSINRINTVNTVNTAVNTNSSDLITKEADRALMRIKEKLEGREEGVILSESGHVAFLIQTATDPELLCQMYVGWQAYF